MSEFLDKIAAWAVNVIANNPEWFVGLAASFLTATLINHAIKIAWTYEEMPRWARLILGFTMPIALNFYHLGEKLGIQRPGDTVTTTTTTTTATTTSPETPKP